MKITNKFRLPAPVVHAVTHDRYNAGEGTDASCTTLIAPAQPFQLNKTVYTELKTRDGDDILIRDLVTEDASLRIWSLMGSAVHYVLENAILDMQNKGLWKDTFISEQRYYHTVGGKRISAQIDLLAGTELSDFKITSVWTIKDAMKNGKEEWTAQLNIQKYLMHHNNVSVESMYIMAFARDWNHSGARQQHDYPPRAVRVKIPFWTLEKTEAYIRGRINALFAPFPVLCTPKECWETPAKFAVKKAGRKSALRLLDTEDNAVKWCADNDHAKVEGVIPDTTVTLKTGISIEKRHGERKRCQDYCEVMPFCDQYKDWLKITEKQNA